MKVSVKILALLSMFCSFFYMSCKDDNDNPTTVDEPVIENLAVTPSSNVSYGDPVVLSGKFSDKKVCNLTRLNCPTQPVISTKQPRC